MLDMDIMLFEYLPKILLAIFCGSLIGLERELKEKPAGMRTYMLICVGATLFTLIGIHFAQGWEGLSDPLRIAGQIVTGVGFLGAGTIIFAKGYVQGLTTAAAIWMSAAIGMAIGFDLLVFSVIVTLIIILSLILLGKIERKLGLKGRKRYKLTITMDPDSLDTLHLILDKASRCHIVEIGGSGEKMKVILDCEFSRKEKASFQKALSKLGGDFTAKIE